MKREITLPEEKELKAVPYPKGYSSQFESMMQKMTKEILQQYRNETYKKLNKGTVEKFEDAQVGNWATIFTTLSNRAKRKIKKRFNNDRIKKRVTEMMISLDKSNKEITYNQVEDAVGISTKDLIAQEGLKSSTNALIQESLEWVNRNVDETLADFSANSLRMMAEGLPVEEVLKGFNKVGQARVQSSKFVARNQMANFNALNNKIRYQNLGITEATWQTAEDERVRPCHAVRNGKRFKLDEGLYSSCDGKTLLPSMDYNCRCIMRPIIPED